MTWRASPIFHPRPVRPIRRQRVETVDHREIREPIGIASPGETVRIAAAVPVLVMMPDDRRDREREADHREDVGADRRVALHDLVLGRSQAARLVEDMFGNRQLANVMQQRRRLDRLNLPVVVDANRPRELDRAVLDAPRVIVRDFVLGIDRMRERLDRPDVDAIDFREVVDLIGGAAKGVPERHVQNDRQRHDQDHRFERAEPRQQHHQHRRRRCRRSR